ncbi:MAG TPA: hypothetical protein VGW75_15415 [Solirubrobacteraceae bacterium]|jgi:hypothetical protein|nr:hypothetical protein [Solirubrobacteraceae bacterium]
MSRGTLLALVAAVVVLAGVPLAIVALDGGGGDDDARVVAGRTVYTEGIDAGNAPADQVDGGGGERERGGAKGRGRGGGRKGPPRDYPESGNVAYPNDVTPSGGEVARVVERHLGAIAPKADQLTVIGADCRAGACTARYVSGPHGGGRILRDAAVIVRRVFALRGVRSLRLYVHEPHGKRSRRVEPMALAVIACRRADHPGYAWTRLTHRQLPRRCSIVEQSPGKLGAQIRKGKLSEHRASRGDAGSSGGNGGASGSSAPKGARPYGSPAPENVKPEDEAGKGRKGAGR